ncbi:lantibiotic dehydratase [Allokutzneria oryzae]|uniref:Lantibiotic dehydratase n=1 Tax=Allokutzneria oryzae TaxID=1378989 RepID=A0ABV5ZTX4_9PSEU
MIAGQVGGGWGVRRPALLRAAGFPVNGDHGGLGAFSSPDCAEVVDGHLAGRVSEELAVKAFEEAAANCARAAYGVATDPRFREALMWQNPLVRRALDNVVESGVDGVRNRAYRRDAELLTRYWQRYCAKTELIGLAGPVCWTEFRDMPERVVAQPGENLVRDRKVRFEHQVLAAYAETLAENAALRGKLPVDHTAESVLHTAVHALGGEALAGWNRLDEARKCVELAVGDADAVSAALDELDTVVEQVTQQPTGGHIASYEDTVRDLDIAFGTAILDDLATPLHVIGRIARWLTAALAESVMARMRELYDGLAGDSPSVPLAQLWHIASDDGHPGVAEDFSSRWAELFTRPEDALSRLDELFPADQPGWSGARLHGVGLHLCAESAERLNAGDYFAVLGEIDIACPELDKGNDCVPSPLPDGLTVGPDLVVRTPEGTVRPLLDVLSELLAQRATDLVKTAEVAPHTPRITVERMVISRETWRTTVGDTGLADVVGPRERYFAVRRWRAALGLPERVFVTVAGETKPMYVDLTSPVFTSILCTALRAAQNQSTRVTITEQLPEPGHAWVPDAQGGRYVSELRVQLSDGDPQ